MASAFSQQTMAALMKITDLPVSMLKSDYDYPAKQMIDKGGYGQVYRVVRKATKQEYAVKEVPKNYDKDYATPLKQIRQDNNIKRERLALRILNSPFIIKLYQTYADSETVYFLLDFAENGDLFRCVIEKVSRYLQVSCVRFFTAEIVMGLQYLRSQDLVHRDLKLENILVDKNFHLKLSDFGSAKVIGQSQGTSLVASVQEKNSNTAGTRCFVAPEVWYKEDVSFGTDYWALGFTIYRMYCRKALADGDLFPSEEAYFKRVEGRQWKYPFVFPDSQINDLVVHLTRRNPVDRIGTVDFQNIKDHEFFQGVDWDNLHHSVSPGLQTQDPSFNHSGICFGCNVPLLKPLPKSTPISSSRGAAPASTSTKAQRRLPQAPTAPSGATAFAPSTNPWGASTAAPITTPSTKPKVPMTFPWAVPNPNPLGALGPAAQSPPSISIAGPGFSTPSPKSHFIKTHTSSSSGSYYSSSPYSGWDTTPSTPSPGHAPQTNMGADTSMASGYHTDTSVGNVTQSLGDMMKLVTSPPQSPPPASGETQLVTDDKGEKVPMTSL